MHLNLPVAPRTDNLISLPQLTWEDSFAVGADHLMLRQPWYKDSQSSISIHQLTDGFGSDTLPLGMALRIFLSVFLLMAGSSFCIAQTQGEMNLMAQKDFQKSDRELNIVYQKVLQKLDAEGKAKLKESERSWIAYRDSEARFEEYVARGGDKGTIGPTVYYSTCTDLTDARIKELQGKLKILTN
jgi:uncharacterized protein YecT (DUF1311 family)